MNLILSFSWHILYWALWGMVCLDVVLLIISDHLFGLSRWGHVLIMLVKKGFEIAILFGTIRSEIIFIKMLIAHHIFIICLFDTIFLLRAHHLLLEMWECFEELRVLLEFSLNECFSWHSFMGCWLDVTSVGSLIIVIAWELPKWCKHGKTLIRSNLSFDIKYVLD